MRPIRTATTATTAASVRLRLSASGLGDRLADRAQRRLDRLRAGDDGAQTAEYAMLGGVGAAACGAVIIILRQEDGPLETILKAVVGGLTRAIRSWF